LLALDVAILPPPHLAGLAIELSAALPASTADRLVLDDTHLPHVTLTQQFVDAGELDLAMTLVDHALTATTPIPLHVSGGGKGGRSVWIAIERTPDLMTLHERLMDALRSVERRGGTAAAFVDGHARQRDVDWVSGFRDHSSFAAFTPHITLGRASRPPRVEPADFDATTVAMCQLGRFCSCRRIIRRWTLSAPERR
jgi:2'-5' RNA ligase